MTVATDTWIRCFHPAAEAPVRLVCFPHAGGSASFFHPVSGALTPRVEVLAVQYPGRQERRLEPLIDSVHDLADAVTEVLRPWHGGPLALFGHSLGASVAFEVAARLERLGTPPVALYASGRRAPSLPREESLHLSDDEGLIARLSELEGTDTRVLADEEILRMVLPAIRGDYKAAETYRLRGETVLSAPVVCLTGADDPQVTREEAAGWRAHTSGPFVLRTFPGGHFYLTERPTEVVAAIEDDLRARLAPR